MRRIKIAMDVKWIRMMMMMAMLLIMYSLS